MEWMDELEKAVRRAPEMDEQDGDEENEEMDGCAPPAMKKGVNAGGGDYAAAENGDDDDEDGVGVHAPTTLDEVAPQRKGKKQKLYPADSKQVKKSLVDGLDAETASAIDVSDVLGGLVKGIDSLAAGRDQEIASLRAEVAQLTKGLGVLGKALAKSLDDTNQIAKSLSAQVDEIGRQPAGRKSTVKKIEKSFAGNGEERTSFPDKAARMQKSMAAIKDGTISPVEASLFESACNRGEFRTDLWRKMGGE